MSTPHLPHDVARCHGVRLGDWEPQCRDCLRRTAIRTADVSWVAPPAGIDWLEQRCPYRIAPEP